MRYPFQKPTLNVIVEDLTTLVDELQQLGEQHTVNASVLRTRATELHKEADALTNEAIRAGRIANKVADLLA